MYRKDQDRRKADEQRYGGLAWHEKRKISTDLMDAAKNIEQEVGKHTRDKDAKAIVYVEDMGLKKKEHTSRDVAPITMNKVRSSRHEADQKRDKPWQR